MTTPDMPRSGIAVSIVLPQRCNMGSLARPVGLNRILNLFQSRKLDGYGEIFL